MRKSSEIRAAERQCCDKTWYIRTEEAIHQITQHGAEAPPEDIFERMLRESKRLERKYGVDELMPQSEYDVGRAEGRLEALRFVLGADWDEDGILDT